MKTSHPKNIFTYNYNHNCEYLSYCLSCSCVFMLIFTLSTKAFISFKLEKFNDIFHFLNLKKLLEYLFKASEMPVTHVFEITFDLYIFLTCNLNLISVKETWNYNFTCRLLDF